jgi:hypothetical protein
MIVFEERCSEFGSIERRINESSAYSDLASEAILNQPDIWIVSPKDGRRVLLLKECSFGLGIYGSPDSQWLFLTGKVGVGVGDAELYRRRSKDNLEFDRLGGDSEDAAHKFLKQVTGRDGDRPSLGRPNQGRFAGGLSAVALGPKAEDFPQGRRQPV